MDLWRDFKCLVAGGVVLGVSAQGAFLPPRAEAQPRDEKEWERIYCDGMERQKYLPTGGFADCLSSEFAIEVDWSDKWAEALGQSLYYAVATDRKPGIILLCEESEGPVEGLCRSYVYRL